MAPFATILPRDRISVKPIVLTTVYILNIFCRLVDGIFNYWATTIFLVKITIFVQFYLVLIYYVSSCSSFIVSLDNLNLEVKIISQIQCTYNILTIEIIRLSPLWKIINNNTRRQSPRHLCCLHYWFWLCAWTIFLNVAQWKFLKTSTGWRRYSLRSIRKSRNDITKNSSDERNARWPMYKTRFFGNYRRPQDEGTRFVSSFPMTPYIWLRARVSHI